MTLLLSSLLLFSYGVEVIQGGAKSAEKHATSSPTLENHTPYPPSKPHGPSQGDVGETYVFWTSAMDPDDDPLFYLFQWGDDSDSGWIGPCNSSENVSASHVWHQRGLNLITVKVKDVHQAESNWSEALMIRLFGPYLSFETTSDGHGLSIAMKNIGELDATNIIINITTANGIFIRSVPDYVQIPVLPTGNSTIVPLRIWGIGLGIFSDLPTLTLTATAIDTKSRVKQITVRILGPFVKKVGESWITDESYRGYTLYSPMVSTQTFLINNNGTVVHTWESSYKPALSVYLLKNGNLLRTALPRLNPRFWGGGIGGRVEIKDWNGTDLWWFEYTTNEHCLHHDIKMLPNGNILMIAWEYKSASEAIAKGRNPNTLPQGALWPDHLIEVQPTGPTSGTIVWEWHLWDHLIQDFDPAKENYGVIQEHPELVNINYGGRVLADWTHTNSVDYNEQFDQILLSVLSFDEIWIIDHSTTTQEAAGHTGGNSGKGGDLLYRWGNPLTYHMGNASDRRLFNQHDAEWIQPGLPGEGNILVFNNGRERPDGEYTSIDEIVPPMANDGSYNRSTGSAFGPTGPIWNYTAENPSEFYAINLGSAQRLPNGDTLICNGPQGQFFEVTNEKEIVWMYNNLVPDPIDSQVFRIYRYGPEYPGLRFL